MAKNNAPFVAILMGSDSDLPVVEAGIKVLKTLEVPVRFECPRNHCWCRPRRGSGDRKYRRLQ